MSKRRFVYYQPNKKDLRDKYGDCTIRALSKALDCTWLEAFDLMIPSMDTSKRFKNKTVYHGY